MSWSRNTCTYICPSFPVASLISQAIGWQKHSVADPAILGGGRRAEGRRGRGREGEEGRGGGGPLNDLCKECVYC